MRRTLSAFVLSISATAAVAQADSRPVPTWVGVPVNELDDYLVDLPIAVWPDGLAAQTASQRKPHDWDPIELIRYYVDLQTGQLSRGYDAALIPAAGISNCGGNTVIAAVNLKTGVLEFDAGWLLRNTTALAIEYFVGDGQTAKQGYLVLDVDAAGNRYRPISSTQIVYERPDNEQISLQPRFALGGGSTQACGGESTAPVVGFSNPPATNSGTPTIGNGPKPDESIGARQLRTPSFPAVVALLSSSLSLLCSGSVVGENAILTSAHCLCRSTTPVFAWIGSWAGSVVIAQEEASKLRLAGWRLYDRDYCNPPSGRSRGYDLALVYTRRPIDLHPDYYIGLDELDAAFSLEPTLIVGFGSSDLFASGGRKTFARLYQNTSPGRICTVSDEQRYGCRADRDLVVVNLLGERRDTCFGDSGGPLLIERGFETYSLVGVTRRGIYQEHDLSCGAGGIYVYPSSPFIRSWLALNIRSAPAEPQ